MRAAGLRASGTTSREGGHEMKVAAVVVTYNRRDLLLESLAAVLAQSRAPDSVIVVDNASEDGTADAVRKAFPGV
jgi:rhamnopyranosyl-N-acetylglucosaminyl-diphospho-decaprenol beta-1,3/1,4-galactofuranosyltransferase